MTIGARHNKARQWIILTATKGTIGLTPDRADSNGIAPIRLHDVAARKIGSIDDRPARPHVGQLILGVFLGFCLKAPRGG
jgi:hypothetical protein